MSGYTYQDLVAAFKSVGLKRGDVVFSHSNIGFFGFPEGERTNGNAFEVILGAFLDVIGKEGTLVVPTFTYSFPHNKTYDPDYTPSDCGVFTEMLRQHPQSYRSDDPCVSVTAIGKLAKEVTINIPENSYGSDSFFDRFYKSDGVICNLNRDAGSTFIHYVERKLNVPYRFDKTFSGVFCKNKKQEERKSTIWVRDLSSDCTRVYVGVFDQIAREKELYRVATVGRGFVGMITAKDTYALIESVLPLCPNFLTQLGFTSSPEFK